MTAVRYYSDVGSWRSEPGRADGRLRSRRPLGDVAVYSLGLGIPFLGLGLSLHRVRGWLRGLGRGTVVQKGVSGLGLVAMGLLLVTDHWLPLVSPVLAW